jgi:hypothetical protein
MTFAIKSLRCEGAANHANPRIEDAAGHPPGAEIRRFATFARDDVLDAAEEARQERAAIHEFDAGMAPHDAEVAAGIKPWTHAEQALHAHRRARAQVLGLALERAEAIAARLVQRDRDEDTRTLCIECRWARWNDCAKRDAYLPSILQRCPQFMKEVDL